MIENFQNIAAHDRAHVWHPYTQMKTASAPGPIATGKGIYLYTEDGRRILDGISSWWVNIHGHSHPRLNEALAEQANQLEHVLFAGFTHGPAAHLAEELTQALPSNLTRIFYSDNGSTAVEVALKMAFQYWSNLGQPQRREFIVLDHAYHGDTIGAMSTSAPSAFTRPFEPLLFQVRRVHAPYCFRCPFGLQRHSCRIDCLSALEKILAESSETVAGVLMEPMLQAAGGMIVWPPDFLSGARRLCDKYQTLLIADEVLTGFGRTGRMFACEHQAVKPDLMCLSKALTGGYLPMGVTAATEAIFEAFLDDDRRKTFFHGHSYTANPLACAVARASLALLREEGAIDRVRNLESLFRSRADSFRRFESVGDVRVIGGVFAIELVRDRETRAAGGYLDSVGPLLAAEFLRRGLLLRPLGNIIYFMPPYVIRDDEAHWALDQIEDVLRNWNWREE
jgi:adenosylmethionine-8-amino-7-oxononanoate aminotransferase